MESKDLLECRNGEMRFDLADFVCCKDISTSLDWKRISGTLQELRHEMSAKSAHPV